MNTAIEITNLRKDFGAKNAVNNLNLSIPDGEIFAFLGVNGAGKTTTIRMLTGLTVPSSGDARVLGHSIITELDEVKKIGNLSPQETSVAPNLTVQENLEFIAGIYGFSKKQSRLKAAEIMEQFGFDEIRNSKAKTLSGGWQRKVSIAMALITDPKILYLDEPTLGLDVLARRELWKVICSLKGKVTIILTTHYMEEAEELSDHIAVLVKGSLVTIGTMAELRAQTGKEKLEDIFVSIVEGME
ncbi:MAG: ABC transporter ATP-binding protein [Oscillospiraceae bacterium]|nr:ABC transporter ATP-binding protein [Oscillospiraceae bacterium]